MAVSIPREREVSLSSGGQVIVALREAGELPRIGSVAVGARGGQDERRGGDRVEGKGRDARVQVGGEQAVVLAAHFAPRRAHLRPVLRSS